LVDIIERVVKAGKLPPELRGDLDAEETVLVSVRARFISSFRGLSSADKVAAILAIELFQENPHDVSLYNHDLVGAMAGRRAFAAAHDLRIVFTERGNYEDVTLLHVGSHSEVYRR